VSSKLKMNDLPDYDDDGSIIDDHGSIVPPGVAILHDSMLAALQKAYPAFKDTWHIVVDTRGGIVQVRNLLLSKDMGFALHIAKIDPEMRRVRKLAGELFERFNVARNKGLSIQAAMKDVKRDPFSRIKYEK